jgi:predicted DNA-binding protein
MPGRTTKIVGFSVPPEMAREIEELASKQDKTKSELFREMVAFYRIVSREKERTLERFVEEVISDFQTRRKAGRLPSAAEELGVFRRLQQSARSRARSLGYTIRSEEDVDRILHE